MRNYLVFISLILLGSSISASDTKQRFSVQPKIQLRFTCEETIGLANKIESTMSRLNEIVQRQRSLAIEASNWTLGRNDRLYLNAEYASRTSEFLQFVDHFAFTDSYGEDYAVFKDGIQFRTLLYSSIDQTSLPVYFKVEPFEIKSFGGLASEIFSLDPNCRQDLPQDYLVMNGVALAVPADSDDTLSSVGNSHSAIAIARIIDDQSGRTGVFADLQTNFVDLDKMDMTNAPSDIYSHLKINGIPLAGTRIYSVSALITAINNYANQTGVRASAILDSDHLTLIGLKLIALDGRNIEVNASDAFAAITGGRIKSGENLFVGKIKLRSSSSIEIAAGYPILGFSGKHTIAVTESDFPHSDILTQVNASNALSILDSAVGQINEYRSSIASMPRSCVQR
ncbi:MAG: flagellin/flagellar hook associated protein [Bacteriovoracaceae bacterium]|nr:flagellin/flagellar hook associated protein [Bacteriovoracaceae bacterium]